MLLLKIGFGEKIVENLTFHVPESTLIEISDTPGSTERIA